MKVIDNMRGLKKVLTQEQDLWRSWLNEQIKVLEMVLAGLQLRYLSGESNDEEWEHTRLILTSGLDSIRDMEKSDINPPSRPSPPSMLKPILEKEETQMKNTTKSSHIKANAVKIGAVDSLKGKQEKKSKTRNLSRSRTQKRGRKAPRKTRRDLRRDHLSERRCRNPWNGKCRNTDIELSIYYNGEFLPICHTCWHEISEKNLEWSGF